MNEPIADMVEKLHREAVQRFREQQERAEQQPDLTQTIHFSELLEAMPDSPLYREWNVYRRELGRLLAEGNAGRHVLIKDEQIVGIWATYDEAMRAGYARFLGQAFLVHQIQERERILRSGAVHPWRNLRFGCRQAS